MKPDWKDAPKWAKWLAQDACGVWIWYEREPYIVDDMWQCDYKSRFEHANKWQETLEPRPREQK